MNDWVTVKIYSELHGISTQAVYKRIKSGNISEDRIRTSDGGKKEILNGSIKDMDSREDNLGEVK